MTDPEMNDEIVEILRSFSDPSIHYAAARIEELERQLDRVTEAWMNFTIRLEQIAELDPQLLDREIDDEFSEQIIDVNIAIATTEDE